MQLRYIERKQSNGFSTGIVKVLQYGVYELIDDESSLLGCSQILKWRDVPVVTEEKE